MSEQLRAIDPQCELSALREVIQAQRYGRLTDKVPAWLHVMASFLGKKFVERSKRFYVVEFMSGFRGTIVVYPRRNTAILSLDVSAFVVSEHDRHDENCRISEALGKPKPRLSDDATAYRKWNAAIEKFVHKEARVTEQGSFYPGSWRCIDIEIELGDKNND